MVPKKLELKRSAIYEMMDLVIISTALQFIYSRHLKFYTNNQQLYS